MEELLQEIAPHHPADEYESFALTPKHIRVLTLADGQAAGAHYYAEGSMKPKGAAAAAHYLTRVTQVFVKEGGGWKVRSSLFSSIAGGSGTSQRSSRRAADRPPGCE